MGNRIEKRLYHLDGTGAVIRQRATHYVRDAQGNPLAVYELLGGDTVVLNEFNLYGSSRLGMLITADTLVCATCTTAVAPSVYLSPVGNKRYELSNHLGNVMTVISDKITPIDTTNDGLWDYFNPSLVSATDYYPFGMGMPGRVFQINQSRFGFNGQEINNEIYHQFTLLSYKFREYNSSVGRFLSPDPLFKVYPWNSSFAFAENSVIVGRDLEGCELQISNIGQIVTGPKSITVINEENIKRSPQTVMRYLYKSENPDKGMMVVTTMTLQATIGAQAGVKREKGKSSFGFNFTPINFNLLEFTVQKKRELNSGKSSWSFGFEIFNGEIQNEASLEIPGSSFTISQSFKIDLNGNLKPATTKRSVSQDLSISSFGGAEASGNISIEGKSKVKAAAKVATQVSFILGGKAETTTEIISTE